MWSQICHAHFGQKLPNLADFGLFWRFFVHYFGCDHPIHFKYFSNISPTGSRQLCTNYIVRYLIWHAHFGRKWWKWQNLATIFRHFFWPNYSPNFLMTSPVSYRLLFSFVRYKICHTNLPAFCSAGVHFSWKNMLNLEFPRYVFIYLR